jgi:hypothetical protein
MKIEIKNRYTDEIIITGKYDSIKEALEKNRNADLRYANLWNADLRYANLRNADLSDANLRNANLRNADLRYANLWNADLRYADLRYANLRNADLSDANLRNANLRNADLRYADLRNADFDTKYLVSLTSICPEGDIIGYKKCRADIIVKLLIPKYAKRSNATTRKCRASYVEVLHIYDGHEKAYSKHDGGKTVYEKSKIVKCDTWDTNRWNECSGGIHFFLTKEEAERW